jgi:hypothetical protein
LLYWGCTICKSSCNILQLNSLPTWQS